MMADTDPLVLREALARVIAGRPVSVVGNATSLLATRHGALIDRGCVLRMNAGVPVRAAAQGRRVDIHCFSTRPNLRYNLGRASWRVWLRRGYFDRAFSVWMSDAERETCADPGQAFYPLALSRELAARFGTRPSTGARVLHMLAELTGAEVAIFGFDFKESPSFYRTKENRGPHDWEAERQFALALAEARGWTIHG